MANYSRSLIQLCECLRGSVPKHADWTSLLGLANQTLTTPALMEVVTRCKDQIPEDVCHYIGEMFERNVVRNDRLAAQFRLEDLHRAPSDMAESVQGEKGSAFLSDGVFEAAAAKGL